MHLVNVKNVFPLNLTNTRLDGYFIAADGAMWSTKQIPGGRKMYGNGGSSPSGRYVTLNNCSYNVADVLRLAKAHRQWAEHTTAKLVEIQFEVQTKKDKSYGTAARSHAKTVADGLAANGIVIARVAVHDGQEFLMFGSKPAIHMTVSSYKDEMTRLAIEHPGVQFVALKVMAAVKAGGLVWS